MAQPNRRMNLLDKTSAYLPDYLRTRPVSRYEGLNFNPTANPYNYNEG